MPVDLPALEQRRVHGLGENAGAERAHSPAVPPSRRRGDLEPAPTPAGGRGRERLARRPDIGDTVRREPLERSDRLTVVAVLGVVIVLDDQRPAAPGPTRSTRFRRTGASTAPVGYWCAGENATASTSEHALAHRHTRPCSSTAIGIDVEPGLERRSHGIAPPPRDPRWPAQGGAALAQRVPDDSTWMSAAPVADEQPLRLRRRPRARAQILGQGDAVADASLGGTRTRGPGRAVRANTVAIADRHSRRGKSTTVGYAAAQVITNSARAPRDGARSRRRLLREPVGDPASRLRSGRRDSPRQPVASTPRPRGRATPLSSSARKTARRQLRSGA